MVAINRLTTLFQFPLNKNQKRKFSWLRCCENIVSMRLGNIRRKLIYKQRIERAVINDLQTPK